jgi:hypothetical protein
MWAPVAQSVWRPDTGRKDRVSNPYRGKRFSSFPYQFRQTLGPAQTSLKLGTGIPSTSKSALGVALTTHPT